MLKTTFQAGGRPGSRLERATEAEGGEEGEGGGGRQEEVEWGRDFQEDRTQQGPETALAA